MSGDIPYYNLQKKINNDKKNEPHILIGITMVFVLFIFHTQINISCKKCIILITLIVFFHNSLQCMCSKIFKTHWPKYWPSYATRLCMLKISIWFPKFISLKTISLIVISLNLEILALFENKILNVKFIDMYFWRICLYFFSTLFCTFTAQKMKFSITDFFSKCDQICRELRIWSHLQEKSALKNFIFCVVSVSLTMTSIKMRFMDNVIAT